jgi:amino acid transporter/mannitol/fructose-specific phosphotransferase system IIA component (Ntr-type)
MGVIIDLLLQEAFGLTINPWHLKATGVACCVIFTVLNCVSVKHTGRFQIFLVGILLAILGIFVVFGSRAVETVRYEGFLDKGWAAVLATSGLVFVSFGGLTKVSSIAEEVRQPGRNLPLGMILAWLVVTIFYVGTVTVTVGLVGGPMLAGSYAPISLAANHLMGVSGFLLLGVAAMAAFITTANGGILAASRSPMAMSRDCLMPPFLARLNRRFRTPHVSVLITGGFMIAAIVFLDIESLVKTASTLKIILFILANLSVITMRESRIQSYRPRFRSPFYPYAHILAIVVYVLLIIDMGKLPLLITATFAGLSAAWYGLYVAKRVSRASAVMHIVERVTARELRTVTLENELRDILLERDQITEDRFDGLVRDCEILDVRGRAASDEVFHRVAAILADRLKSTEEELFEKFLQRETEGTTVVQPGLAIPHIVVGGRQRFDILLVRAVDGIDFENTPEPVQIMFVLAGSSDERNYHLRALMAIAQIAQEKDFQQQWLEARDTEAIRNLILLSKRKRDPAAGEEN